MVITICGSMKFAKQMAEVKKFLEERGDKVLAPPLLDKYLEGKIKKGEEPAKLKMMHDLIRTHFREIERSGAILVLNYNKGRTKNYIGGNTLMEMGYAFYLNKKIFLLNPIPYQNYRDEIVAMQPKVLKGDLGKIQ